MSLLDQPLGTVKTVGAASTAVLGHVILDAGTAAIGKLAANAGVDIGAVEEVMPTAGSAAQVTGGTAGTATQFASFACAKGVTVTHHIDSPSAHMCLGWATGDLRTTNSIRLYPGQSIFIPVSNTNKLWHDGPTSAFTFSWLAT